MPNNFTGHIDKWLLLSESETDFATLFVRSWIPFNAWYCNHYTNTSDRYCIDHIKTDGNQFRAKLIALLTGTNSESNKLKIFLRELKEVLEANPIPDASDNQISFTNIYFRRNPKNLVSPTRKRNMEYKAEVRANNSVLALIVNPTTTPVTTKHNYTHTKWDLAHFDNDLNATTLNDTQKNYMRNFFIEINPKKKESIVSSQRAGAIDVNGLYLVNDTNLVSAAIIEILYSIRCKLFHGELQPSKGNLSIYEPAYHLMRILLKSLK